VHIGCGNQLDNVFSSVMSDVYP